MEKTTKIAIGAILMIGLIVGAWAIFNKPVEASPKTVDFYYSPYCSHCMKVKPTVDSLKEEYTNWAWSYHDVTKEQTNIRSVPTIKIVTSDNREITLRGDQEIPRWLECELAEQSSNECPTYVGDYNHETNSWFVR